MAIFQSSIFFGPPFSGPANSAPPTSSSYVHIRICDMEPVHSGFAVVLNTASDSNVHHNAPIRLKLKSLTFEAWLLLKLYRLLLANFKLKRIAAASRGFLVSARLSCTIAVTWQYLPTQHYCTVCCSSS